MTVKHKLLNKYSHLIYFLFFISIMTGEAQPDLPPLTARH